MKTETLNLAIPADPTLIPTVQKSIRQAVRQHGSLPSRKLQDLDFIVSEVASQAIAINSTWGTDTVVKITAEIAKNSVTLTITDAGKPAAIDLRERSSFDEFLSTCGKPWVHYLSNELSYDTDHTGNMTKIEIS